MVIISGVPIFRIFTVGADEVAHYELPYLHPCCLYIYLFSYFGALTHCILVDSSTIICWASPFVILRVSDLFCCFYSIFDGKSC